MADEREKLREVEDERTNKTEETFARLAAVLGSNLRNILLSRVADLDEAIEATKEEAKRLELSRHFIVERVRKRRINVT